jgi:hypothetical protein
MKVKLESMKIKLLLLRILMFWCKLDEFEEVRCCMEYLQSYFIHESIYKVNNNQHVDLTQNQMMWCIICHNEMVNLEILVLHIRCHHWLPQGIITMWKNTCKWSITPYFIYIYIYIYETTCCPKSPLECEVTNKWPMLPTTCNL